MKFYNHSSDLRDGRNLAIRLAVVTSLISKGGNLLLQLIAVPVAIVVLGKEMFGVYASVSGLLFLACLVELGLSSSVARSIAQAMAAKDREQEAIVFTTGATLVTSLAVFGAIVLVGVFESLPVSALFGPGYEAHAETIRTTFYVGLGIYLLKLLGALFQGARLGYQEVFATNLYGALGNVTAGLLLIFGIKAFPNIVFLLICVWGIKVLVQVANGVHLLIQRPYLWPKRSRISKPTVTRLMKDGLSLSVAQNGAHLAQREGCKLILSHAAGPVAVAVYAVLLQLSIFLTGFIVMILQPLWSAITEATASKDFQWIASVRKKMVGYTAGFGVLAVIGLLIGGPLFIHLWTRGEIEVSRMTMLCYGVYFAFMMWSTVHFSLLTGMGKLVWPALVLLPEIMLLLLFAYLGSRYFGLNGMLIGMATAIASVSGWAFVFKLRQVMKRAGGHEDSIEEVHEKLVKLT